MITNKYKTINLFGIPILAITISEVLQMIDQAVKENSRLDIGVVNAAKIVNMNKNAELRNAVLSSDVIFADGASVVLASKLLGKPLPERIAGIDLMWEIFKKGNKENYRVFCLGATEEVNKKVADILENEYPCLILAGRRNGYFDEAKEEEVAQEIAESNSDILLVAMTSPKKEKFMAKWGEKMKVSVIHGVGGSFDVMAGKVKRAPTIWQKFGMEWLYRVIQEPRRLWKRYLITNTQFLWMLFKESMKKLKIRNKMRTY